MLRFRRICLFSFLIALFASVATSFSVDITLIQKLTGPELEASFGTRMMPAGDTNGDGYPDVLIAQSTAGRTFLYYGSSTGLVPSGWFMDGFTAMASAGDVDGDGFDDIIAGNPETGLAMGLGGQAQLFLGSATVPSASADWTRDGQNAESFGKKVLSAGDTNDDGYDDVMVSAPNYDDGALLDSGAVYVFNGSRQGLGSTPTVTLFGISNFSLFGDGLARMGDVDGDGFEDVVIGDPIFGDFGDNFGKVFLHFGSATDLETTAAWTFVGDPINGPYGNLLGRQIVSAGDVNGDGYQDLLIGDDQFGTDTLDNSGQATVTLGTASGFEPIFQWFDRILIDFSFWGQRVAGGGDINGDGFDDVLVGSSVYPQTGPTPQAGYVRLFLGQAAGSGVNDAWSWDQYGEHSAAFFGEGMTMVGDLNGDGRTEFAISSPLFISTTGDEVGAVYIYSGCDEGDADGVCDFMDNCLGLANTAQVDGDTDGFGDACDCAVSDPSLWSAPGPVSSLTVSPDAGSGSTLDWIAPTQSGSSSGAMTYDTLRSSSSSFSGASCLESGGTDRVSLDATDPSPGQVFFYLVRPLNSCGWATASLGVGTGNVARSAPSCT